MQHLAIFASGGGSNAQRIIEFFQDSTAARVAVVISNKPDAGVLHVARAHSIAVQVVTRKSFYETEELLAVLAAYQVNFIALAGFLWLIPPYLVRAFPRRIVNIHPALLPKFGGKGMYGHHVHAAVQAAGESETGMTIHFVDDHYDEGDIIFQARCPVLPEDTPEDIARRVLALEHAHFPAVIGRVMSYKL